jgi:hypothetical protein
VSQARVDHMLPEYKASPRLSTSAGYASKHPAITSDPRVDRGTTQLQVTLVHSWDASDEGQATNVRMLAALRLRAAVALPSTSWLSGASQTPVLQAPLRSLNDTLQWLTQQEEVHAVDLVTRYGKRNQEAQWIVQSGDVDARTVWARGIRGQGQMVGVSDTGFDATNCLLSNSVHGNGMGATSYCEDCTMDFFDSDDGEPVPDYCTFTSTECTTPSDARKIVGYLAYAKNERDTDGHGVRRVERVRDSRAKERGELGVIPFHENTVAFAMPISVGAEWEWCRRTARAPSPVARRSPPSARATSTTSPAWRPRPSCWWLAWRTRGEVSAFRRATTHFQWTGHVCWARSFTRRRGADSVRTPRAHSSLMVQALWASPQRKSQVFTTQEVV